MKRLSPPAAREWSRTMFILGAATALATVVVFFFVLPDIPTWGYSSDELALMAVTRWIPLVMAVFGLAWLVRIYRRQRDPEAGPSPWRFHKWD